MNRNLAVFTLLLIPVLVSGEILKFATSGKKGLDLQWWPKLPEVKGWHQDKDMSKHYALNALAPNGSTFANSPVVMTGKACYKPKVEEHSLAEFIKDDEESFKKDRPGIKTRDVDPLTTKDGQKLRTVEFIPTKNGDYELVSYGVEGDFYLVFTLSSRTKQGFDASLKTFKGMIHHYKR